MSRYLMNHRFLGVLFVGLLVFSVWMVNAVFTQKFTSFDRVDLTTNSAGLQLPSRADVKVRGVIVGQVTKMESTGQGAELELGIKPDEIGVIPADVTAAILPKTLFGEKYVELNIPEDSTDKKLADGDRIKQTALPIEVERILNDLYPLLRTVEPAELNYTLNALATALEGRGDQLGEGLITLDRYLKRLNPEIPQLIEDIKLLVTVSGTYADVLPQLAEVLRNTVKTGNTLRGREAKLNAFLKDFTAFSDTATGFVNDNGNNIIRLGEVSEPILALLADYAPIFKCLPQGLSRQAPFLAETFRGFIFHINLRTLPRQPRGFNASDRPVFGARNPANCVGLPTPRIPLRNVPQFADGSGNLGKRSAPGFGVATPAKQRSSITVGTTGTPEQKALINSLTAPVLGVPIDEVPDLTSLLFTPVAAGTEVSVR